MQSFKVEALMSSFVPYRQTLQMCKKYNDKFFALLNCRKWKNVLISPKEKVYKAFLSCIKINAIKFRISL